jgi:tRNA (mo5U34)-methyltransferase
VSGAQVALVASDFPDLHMICAVSDSGTTEIPADSALLNRVDEITWYHTIELAPGLATPGEFDHRPYVNHYGLPDRMDGMRAIDVATFNGFWAFEMERRGAEVVALDLGGDDELDWPAFRPREKPPAIAKAPLGEGFRVAHSLLGSKVQRVECNVYDADPRDLGSFDLVFCGSMLIHIKNQFLGLERLRNLLRPGGMFVSAEGYSSLAGVVPFPVARYAAHRQTFPVFWEPSVKTWRLMIEACGFTEVRKVKKFNMRARRGYSVRHVVHHATRD